ncbi:MAG: transposase [Cyclobacteriaceae bacterium]|nr:transposase [Cyclobacteriaceae bacterium]
MIVLPVLSRDIEKKIIIDSLRFLVSAQRIKITAFVLMDTHFHLIWQVLGEHKREDVQRDFLRFTAQQLLKQLRNEKSELLSKLQVNTKDRTYQVWQRNSLSIELRSAKVFLQKLEYIHNNPVKAGLCALPEDYRYTSARFYEVNVNEWDFLTHYERLACLLVENTNRGDG